MSGSTVIRYKNSGEVFKERYKFSPIDRDRRKEEKGVG